MFTNTYKTTPIHIVIAVLIVCLLSVIGLYLYSVYHTQAPQQTITNTSVKDISHSSTLPHNPTSLTQPDKSLPIPAHQLKKIIATPVSSETTELQAQITAVNQKIAQLDQQLAVTEREQPQKITNAEKDQAIQKRLDHLREHVEKSQ